MVKSPNGTEHSNAIKKQTAATIKGINPSIGKKTPAVTQSAAIAAEVAEYTILREFDNIALPHRFGE